MIIGESRILMIAVFFEMFYQYVDRIGALVFITINRSEHFDKEPLRPFVIFRTARHYFPRPVKTQTYFIELFFISSYIFFGSISRVFACLDSILLGRQTKAVKTHRVQYIVAFHTLESGVDIARYIT